jgi:hypothetical protein
VMSFERDDIVSPDQGFYSARRNCFALLYAGLSRHK